MAHEIASQEHLIYNSVAVEQKTGRRTPWHGQGIPHEGRISRDVIPDTIKANVDSYPLLHPLTGNEVENRRILIHSGTGQFLNVVSDQYKVVQMSDVLSVIEHLVADPNGPIFDTAGILKNGKTAFVNLALPEHMTLKLNGIEETVRTRITVTNNHGGTGSFELSASNVIVVCQNTLNLALGSGAARVSVMHRGDPVASMKALTTAAGGAIELIQKGADARREYLEMLGETPFTLKNLVDVIEDHYRASLQDPQWITEAGVHRRNDRAQASAIVESHFRGLHSHHPETAFRAVMAVTEGIQHHKQSARNVDQMFRDTVDPESTAMQVSDALVRSINEAIGVSV